MYTNEDKEKVRSLFDQGHSIRKIAEMTGIPKSSVAELKREQEPSDTLQTLSEPDEEGPDGNDNALWKESYGLVDSSRTFSGQNNAENRSTITEPDNIRTNPGQINPYVHIPICESSENMPNWTKMVPEYVSPEWLELKKIELQLQHDREMKKLEQEEARIWLRERAAEEIKQEFEQVREKKTERAENISFKIRAMASELLNKVEMDQWDSTEAEDLYEDAADLLDEFKEFCIKYNINFKDSAPFRFLKWLKEDIASWLDEVDEETEIDIEFSCQDIKKIERATKCDISTMF